MKTKYPINRRNFLKVSSIAGGGLFLSFGLPVSVLSKTNNGAFEPNLFLKIDAEGTVTYMLTKMEMGQGSSTGLAMIIADELGADWERFKIESASSKDGFEDGVQGVTGGSSSIRRLWDPLRKAGAVAREMLVEAAARVCEDKKENFYTKNGKVIHKTKKKELDFGELVKVASQLKAPDPEKVTLRDPKEYQLIGKPVSHKNTYNVVTGKLNYGINVQLPDMLHAVIARCPVHQGKLKSVDDTEAKKMPGVKAVVKMTGITPKNQGNTRLREGVVVIADSTWNALQARKALKITWDEGKFGKSSIDSLRKTYESNYEKEAKPVYTHGDIKTAFREADLVVEEVYENPYQAHAMMEPLNATAHFRGDTCEVWTGTQYIKGSAEEVAHVLELPIEKVKVHSLPSGGAFGRRYHLDFVIEAAFVSQQVKAPVKVTWSREDEIQHDYYHPFYQMVHKASIKDNQVTGWDIKPIHQWSGSGIQSHEIIYDFPNILTHEVKLENMIEVGAWRSVGEHLHGLGRECFMDELAHKTGKDPLAFRMGLLDKEIQKKEGENADLYYRYDVAVQERYKSTLKKVTEAANWGKKRAKGSGQGLAVVNFSWSVCAQVADVTVKEGELTIDKITCALHCGRVINPHFVKGQVEGGIIWAITALKYGGLEVENGRVQRSNFHNNKILRMGEIPEIEVHLIESDDAPVGAGEPAVPPLAPAVLNAIFAATGKRIRKIPVLKEDLLK